MQKLLNSMRPVFLGILGTLIFLGLWEGVSRAGIINENLFPPVSVVAAATVELLRDGELQKHLAASMWRAAAGFIIGSAMGIVFGVLTARVEIFRDMTNPLLQMFRSIPSIAFVPLAIFWFGIGETSKIFLICWGVFFPAWINTFLGVRDINPLLLRAASTLGANGTRMLISVILPSALPMILAGLRVSVAVSLVLLVAAELAGAKAGVGYLIQLSGQVFRVDNMIVGLLTLGVLGLLADTIFVVAVRRLFPLYGAESRAAEG